MIKGKERGREEEEDEGERYREQTLTHNGLAKLPILILDEVNFCRVRKEE